MEWGSDHPASHKGTEDKIMRIALAAFLSQYYHLLTGEEPKVCSPVKIKRLDTGRDYYLVHIQKDGIICGIAQIGDPDFEVESTALIKNPATIELLPVEKIIRKALDFSPGMTGMGVPFLGWQPCRESFSSLNPFWIVPHAEGNLFITQKGDVFKELSCGYGG